MVILGDMRSGRVRTTLKGHSTPIGDLRWSPNGRMLASCSDDGTLLWNPTADGPQANLVGGSPRRSPDGKNLVTLCGNTAIVWDAITLKERGRLVGHKNEIDCLAWSPDGKLLAAGTGDLSGFWRGVLPDVVLDPGSAAIVWDAATLKARHVLTGHSHNSSGLMWSADGRFLATGSWDQSVIIWDVATGERAAALTEELDEVVNAVAWSPDGKFLATTFGSFSNRTALWEIVRTRSVAK
jgi:WD40 repeat protein